MAESVKLEGENVSLWWSSQANPSPLYETLDTERDYSRVIDV